MKKCTECKVDVLDNWNACPLCDTPLIESGKRSPSTSFPEVGLRFQRRKVKQSLTLVSLLVILIYFISQSIWRFRFFGLEFVLFGLMVTWMMVLVLIRKRRNIVKGIVYILFLFSLLSVYFDYILGWLSVLFSFIMFWSVLLRHGTAIKNELSKRMHV